MTGEDEKRPQRGDRDSDDYRDGGLSTVGVEEGVVLLVGP